MVQPLALTGVTSKSEYTSNSSILLPSVGFQTQAGGLVHAENDVHVLHGLPGGTLAEIVYHTDDVKLPSVFPDIQHSLVRPDDHLHVRIRIHDEGKWFSGVIVLVQGEYLPIVSY